MVCMYIHLNHSCVTKVVSAVPSIHYGSLIVCTAYDPAGMSASDSESPASFVVAAGFSTVD